MKIEHLRFKNLNALVGEWEIDFSHPAYDAAGIFAITGPTGAGKTTLLDAICLALYGQTPRLDAVTKNSNDIMSRHTGECFAEVTFTTQSGRYRVLWAQRRARKSPHGELQVPQRELADALSGVILESSLRKVSEKIMDITGMDFDRFTRAVVLAQGGFAAFLQASADERAPLLEQITGTEIYSQISIAVHARRVAAREKFMALEATLSGLPILDAETLASVTAEQQRAQDASAALQQQLAKTQTAIQWHAQALQLDADILALQTEFSDFMQQWEADHATRTRLQWATQARTMAGDYAALVAQRGQWQRARDDASRFMEALPQRKAQAAHATEACDLAQKARDAAKEKDLVSRPVVQGMRQLDSQIQDIQKKQQALTAALAKGQGTQAALQEQIHHTTTRIEQAQANLAIVAAYLQEHPGDAHLSDNWRSLQDHIKRMVGLSQTLAEADLACDVAVSACTALAKDLAMVSAAALEAQSLWATASGLAATAEETHAALLADGDETALRTTLDSQRAQWQMLQQGIVAASEYQLWQTRLGASQKAYDDLSAAIVHAAAAQAASARELDLVEKNQRLMAQIHDLEGLRAHLGMGDPCPLCGSEAHPYQTHGLPEAMGAEVVAVKERHQTCVQQLADLQKQQVQTMADQHYAQESLQRIMASAEWHCYTTHETPAIALAHLEHSVTELEKRLADMATSAKALSLAKESLSAAKDRVVQAEKDMQAIENRHLLLQQTQRTQQGAAEQCREKIVEEWLSFYALIADPVLVDRGLLPNHFSEQYPVQDDTQLPNRFGHICPICARHDLKSEFHSGPCPYSVSFSEKMQQLIAKTLPEIFESLKLRRSAFEAKMAEKVSLEKTCVTEAAALAGQMQLLQHQEAHVAETQRALFLEDTQLQVLVSQRQQTYGTQDPDQLESETTSALSKAETTYEQLRQAYDVANAQYQDLQTRYEEALQLRQRYEQQLDALEKHCKWGLHAAGFADEDAYLAAVMSESDYLVLAERVALLDKNKTILETRLAEKQQQQTTHKAACPTDVSMMDLQTRHAGLQSQIAQLQQDIGALSQRLADHDNHTRQRAAQTEKLALQRADYDRISLLHDLIGSADGKKYRNFAQGLTFERMVQAANHHLHRMTDRYTLLRDGEQPLLLNVVDHYQGDVLRVTRNLSGGESFIVSLALALGLSQLSSRTVRLDSLFLDEGFGTLDEEVLETVLSTLSALHHEGKRIGVISHIQALKDRIGTQILVYPESGGRSGLEGPGVFRNPS